MDHRQDEGLQHLERNRGKAVQFFLLGLILLFSLSKKKKNPLIRQIW
jgi:hypothetical protein